MLQKYLSEVLNYFPVFGLIIIIFYLYFSKKISRDKINCYLLVGLASIIISDIIQYYTNHYLRDFKNPSEVLKWYPVTSVIGNFGYRLILYGIIVYLLKFEILKNEIKRENIFLIILYSALSVGLYIPYWFIRKNMKFDAKLNLWIILLIFFLSCNHVYLICIFNSPSDWNKTILQIVFWMGQIGYPACFLVCIYTLRNKIMEKIKGLEINPVWTFFVGILHVQYLLNQYIKKHEK